MSKTINDVIIIGAGPAGIACAIQLKRYGINPLIIEKNSFGGLLRNANLIENYTGFPGGISGKLLVSLFREQFKNEKLKFVREEVISVSYTNKIYIVKTSAQKYYSKVLVIASGTRPNEFNELQLNKNILNYIYYDIYKIADSVKKKIVIVGAGDLAFDYALNLGKRNNITILNRTNEIKSLKLLANRTKKLKSFTYYRNTEIKNIYKTGFKSVTIECKSRSKLFELEADCIIFAIGRNPELSFLDKKIKKVSGELRRNRKLFFIGDVINKHYRQTSIATGDGVKIAMTIYEKTKREKWK